MAETFSLEEATQPETFSLEEAAQPETFGLDEAAAPVISQHDPNEVSAIAGGTHGAFLHGGFSAADLPDKADVQEEVANLSRPAVALPKFTVQPDDSKTAAVAKTAANLVAGLPEFAESPLGVASLAAGGVAPRVVAAAFLGDTAKNVVQGAKQAGENWDQMTPAEKAATATDLAGQTVLTAALAHATTAHTPTPAEQLASELDRTAPQGAALPPATPQTFSLTEAVQTPVRATVPKLPATVPPPAAAVPEPAATVPESAPSVSPETPSAPREIPLLPVEVSDQDVAKMRGPAEERPPDLLDTIGDHFPNGVQFASQADFGEYVKQAQGAAKELMSHTEGEPADQVLDGLHLAGEAQGIENEDELAQAMVDAGATRIGQRGQGLEEARALAEMQARDKLFAEANDPKREGAEPVRPEQLFVGDQVQFAGQPMRVTGFATDAETGAPTGVELEGAYGRQIIPVGQALHIDKGSLVDDMGLAHATEAESPGRVAASGTSAPRGDEEIPLGINRPDKENAALRDLSDAEFDAEFRAAKQGVNEAERSMDESPELALDQRKKVAEAQDRWSAARLERIRRNDSDTHTEDIFRKMIDLADVGHDFAQFRVLANILKARGGARPEDVTALYRQLPARLRGDADFQEALGGKLGRFKEWLGQLQQEKTPGRVASAGTSAPRPQRARPLAVPPQVAKSPVPSVGPLRQWFQHQTMAVKSVVAPQSISPEARGVGNALRHFMGENAIALARADEAMASYRKEFDQTPVPASWHYNPAQPLPHNYAIIDALERDPASLPQRYQDLAKTFQPEFDWRVKEIQKYAPNALQHLITNYFPHVWKDPERAGDAMVQVASRLFAGRKEFLKQRTLPMFRDGLERGLQPISDNPVDLLIAKMHSMDKFLMALKAVDEFKQSGAMKFKYALEKMPDGFQKIDDPSFIVNGPPTVTIKEAFDAQLRTRTQELLQKLGVPEKRLATLGGKRWGMAYESPEQIKTRFGGPMSVYWHELGHIMDYRYNLQDTFLKQGKDFDAQLRALADRRLPAGYSPIRRVLNRSTGKVVNRPASMTKYVRSAAEKMAVMNEAYVHAPEVFQRVAPDVYKKFDAFIESHPELHDIRELKPSLRLGTAEMEQKLPGVLKLGDWIMPDGPAAVMKNHLSPGLSRFAPYRSFKSASNILNAAQLGLSGFHLGFTSLDAATSRLAIGIEDLSRGHAYKAAKTFASVPASPVTNIMQGARIMREALHPGSTDAETASLVHALELAGGRIGQDRFWQTDFMRRLKRAWNEGTATGYLKTIPLAPLTAIEQAMRPIMEYVVPRQKLGVFADMARRELERLGPNAGVEETREAMRKAWDSVDNRMGQVVYDNLFYNRAVKDLALMAFRAYGWQLGKYREGLGAVADTAAAGKDLAQGRRPDLSHRMAYAMALPLMVGTIGATMNYLMTGQRPQDWRDYFMPRTGQTDANGNAARLNLPTYMKDVIAYAKHPIESVGHSLNPMFSAISDLLGNHDFYDVQIHNPDDPLWRQGSDVAKFAAKQFIPFSVSGTQKLRELNSPLNREILPFFGVTPVPGRMTMTPAQELASEITAANLPASPRTQEQFDKSKLVREIIQDFRNGQNTAGRTALAQGFETGRLNVNTVHTILDRLKYTPLQFQVHHMDVPAAMRVWRVARPDERTQLTPMIETKLVTSKTLTAAQIQQYTAELKRAQ